MYVNLDTDASCKWPAPKIMCVCGPTYIKMEDMGGARVGAMLVQNDCMLVTWHVK